MTIRAIIYTRFSDRRNAGKSESCEIQEAVCRAHATAKGWTVDEVHQDKAKSGKDTERPGLAAAVAALRRGDVLLVYKRDRLARDVLLAELTRRQVAGIGATIEAVSGDVSGDDKDPTVIFVRQIMDAVAELERKQIAARTRDALRQHQRNGKRVSRFPPYGTKFVGFGRIEPDEEEQVAVRRALELASQGEGIADITRRLNEECLLLARGTLWRYPTVKRIIRRG